MQWFKIPNKIYFEAGSTSYLSQMPDISRAFIVTDPSMTELHYVDKVLYQLRKIQAHYFRFQRVTASYYDLPTVFRFVFIKNAT